MFDHPRLFKFMSNIHNLDNFGRLPETNQNCTALIVGPNTITDFFAIHDPEQVHESLMELFSFAIGNPELGSGHEVQNMLSLIRNIEALIYAVEYLAETTTPVGDA
jgi:hypothetical protein